MNTTNEIDFDSLVTADTTVHTEQDFFESNLAGQSEAGYRDDEDDEYANVNCNEI